MPISQNIQKNQAFSRLIYDLIKLANQEEISQIKLSSDNGKAIAAFLLDDKIVRQIDLDTPFEDIMSYIRSNSLATGLDGDAALKASRGQHTAKGIVHFFETALILEPLSQDKPDLSLDDLHLSRADIQRLFASLRQKRGLIITGGPGQSGKNTTRRAIINSLPADEMNIVSLGQETAGYPDRTLIVPCRYPGYDWSQAVASLRRHDADAIDIDDLSQAPLDDVLRLAQDKLVIASLSCNSTADCLERLIGQAADKKLLCDTLTLTILHLPARASCHACVFVAPADRPARQTLQQKFGLTDEDTAELPLSTNRGCRLCSQSGLGGRLNLFETLYLPGTKLRQHIAFYGFGPKGKELAEQETSTSWAEDALIKSGQGLISLDEIDRIF